MFSGWRVRTCKHMQDTEELPDDSVRLQMLLQRRDKTLDDLSKRFKDSKKVQKGPKRLKKECSRSCRRKRILLTLKLPSLGKR